jgi:hypothetical protein
MKPNNETAIAITAQRAYLSLIFWITDIRGEFFKKMDGENRGNPPMNKMWKTAESPKIQGFY